MCIFVYEGYVVNTDINLISISCAIFWEKKSFMKNDIFYLPAVHWTVIVSSAVKSVLPSPVLYSQLWP